MPGSKRWWEHSLEIKKRINCTEEEYEYEV